jgi:uracil-DNA glycosylase
MDGPPLSLDDLRDEIRNHTGCGFEPCETATNMVPGEGNPDADVMLVGEAPGASEDKQGRPFVGRAGKLLDELLAAAGLTREQVYITNVVKARPPNNRDPRAGEVAHHMPWLEAELAIVQPSLVVPLGRHALAHFTDDAKITQVHGTEMTERGRSLFPMYHPAAALRGGDLRETLFEDARKLKKALGRQR